MIDRDHLVGNWRHAHEDDTDQEMVFKPANEAFPPSRGRAGLELRADSTYTETQIGPDDRPNNVTGTWSITNTELRLMPHDPQTSTRRLVVVHAQPHRLTLKK